MGWLQALPGAARARMTKVPFRPGGAHRLQEDGLEPGTGAHFAPKCAPVPGLIKKTPRPLRVRRERDGLTGGKPVQGATCWFSVLFFASCAGCSPVLPFFL